MSTEAPAEEQDTAPAPYTARKLLVDWANSQDGWVRSLVSEVLSARRPLTDETLDQLYAQFLSEKGLSTGEAPTIPALDLQGDLSQPTDSFVVKRLNQVGGVNALTAGQEITFNAGLTVLFGENGAGKTGYARIFKCLAAVRTAEPILPNVHDTSAADHPSARIEFETSGQEQILEWNGEKGVAPFTHLSIFDTPAVRFHVDGDLAYVYTPSDLALFRYTADGLDGVKSRAESDATTRRPTKNPHTVHFRRDTPVYAAVETLGPATDMAELERIASLSDEEAKGLELLRQRVESLQPGALQARLSVARSRHDLHQTLQTTARIVRAFDVVAYQEAVAAAAKARTDYASLRATLFEAAGIEGEPDDTWQSFVLNGDAYREHLDEHDYPKPGDRCLYCRQALSHDAVRLLRQYREFANDAGRQRIEDAQRLITTLTRDLIGIHRSQLATSVARHREEDTADEALTTAGQFLDALDAQYRHLQVPETVDWGVLSPLAERVETESAARCDAASQLITDLTAQADERARALQVSSGKLAALEARLELQRRLPDIRTHVALSKWAQRLGQLASKFSSLKRSLTDMAKIASEQLLNTDFERRFVEECRALRAPTVRLEFPGRDGQAARRKVVSATHPPSAVLSEGEQKVIALADFLAESSLRLSAAPIVFDDPVTSFDHRRIHEVADRIADLAANRQVIVFTHNIWFTTKLLARFDKNRSACSYYTVGDEPSKGIILSGTHPRWDTVSKVTGRINGLLQDAAAVEGEARDAIVETAYSRIRAWCEVVVEQELLMGVTQRYQAHVMMTRLGDIKGERLTAATATIQPIFEKACRLMDGHSQPLETLSVRPTLEELRSDWTALTEALAAYRA